MEREEQRRSLDWQKIKLERSDHSSFSKTLVRVTYMLRKKNKGIIKVQL